MERYTNFTRVFPGSTPAPGASVSVSVVGDPSTLIVIYSDNGVTPKANPFLADVNGEYFFYAANGKMDVNVFNIATPYTISDVLLYDVL